MDLPLRFRTREDADLFVECVRDRKPFPVEKHIWPFVMVGECACENPEYRDAPFEQILLVDNSGKVCERPGYEGLQAQSNQHGFE